MVVTLDTGQRSEWAEQAIDWPRLWSERAPSRPITTTERLAARNWLARAGGHE